MSRVSFATYCERRTKLGQSWQTSRSDFLGISPKEQWILHEYYRFSESLTLDQLHQHLTELHAKRSSMAQRAGRAYSALGLAPASKPTSTPQLQGRKRKLDKVKVEPLVLPQPDSKKVAKILLEILRSETS